MDGFQTIMTELAPRTVRYIKLGQGGRWAQSCFERLELQFGDASEPHDRCLAVNGRRREQR